jgi:hypothetical protein
MKRLPTGNSDRLHDGSEASSHLERLRRARQLAVEHNLAATDKQKENFDVKATHHSYHVGQFVLLEDFNFLNKNRKLAAQFSGPFRVLRVKGDHNVELLLTNGRKMVVNIARIKPYLRESLPAPSDVAVASGDTPPTDASSAYARSLSPPRPPPGYFA